MRVNFTLDKYAEAPQKAHEADAGFDLKSNTSATIYPKCGAVFDTGVHVEIPKWNVGYVKGRSGLNVRHDIICPTGTVDSGYTGSIKVKLYNLGEKEFRVNAGDKIAQLVIQPIADVHMFLVDELDETERGDNGFGSTGR